VPEQQRWLVSSEGAFSYLAADLGWREAYLWPINAEEQGTSQQVRRLIDLVPTNKVPVVFSESTISDRPARQIARETGARYGGVLYVDSLSAAGGPVPTYLKLIETTVEDVFDQRRDGLIVRVGTKPQRVEHVVVDGVVVPVADSAAEWPAQLGGDDVDAGLHEPSSHEQLLSTGVAPVTVPGLVVLTREVKRFLGPGISQ
jgi:hypothetical protein